jgi:hypothetical protein
MVHITANDYEGVKLYDAIVWVCAIAICFVVLICHAMPCYVPSVL